LVVTKVCARTTPSKQQLGVRHDLNFPNETDKRWFATRWDREKEGADNDVSNWKAFPFVCLLKVSDE